MLSSAFVFLCRFPPLKRLLWRSWYDFLAGRYREQAWTFMNYGYAGDSNAPTLELAPADEPERYCAQLYHFVASLGGELRGKHVVEVGSGRGGGAAFVHRYLRPASLTGVDFSAKAVSLAQRRHASDGLSFRVGSAEALPLQDSTFDAVLNVESSHCYASMTAFLAEVKRVLKPGGRFLYADLRASADLPGWRALLQESGLSLMSETDITSNVLTALDLDHDRKAKLLETFVPRALQAPFEDFAGMKGSVIHEGFRTGRLTYRAFLLEK